MTSEGQKCSLGSLISMSCRGRAEAFARRLHTKLKSLSSDDGPLDETSWLAAPESLPVAVAQPSRHHDLELPESPASPEEEALINRDGFRKWPNDNNCDCGAAKSLGKNPYKNSTSNDSDSDCSFYDTENETTEQRLANGDACSERGSPGPGGEREDDSFASISDSTPQPSSSLSEDASTMSLRDDEEAASSGVNGSLTDVSRVAANGVIFVVEEVADSDRLDDESSKKSESEYWTGDSEYDDLDVAETLRPRVRRCSSLKTGKTPPGTPAIKKIVRFADALGLDLADVRTFLDEVPQVPVSAFGDLADADLCESLDPVFVASKLLIPLFQQPGGQPDFLDSVREHQVRLENAVVDDPVCLSVAGIVRVRNLDFNKSVHIRYSLDSWKTFADVQASYVDNSCDGFSDKFAFLLYAHTLAVGQRLEFACRFQCNGCQYWDSNEGANYCFQCLPASGRAHADPLPSADDWGASFYYHEVDSSRTEELREHIMEALASKGVETAPKEKSNSMTFVVVLLLSFLILCLQRAIYIL